GGNGGAYLIVTLAAGSTYQGTGGSWAGALYYGTSALSNTLLTTAGATFEITNWKLEVAPAVTPFQRLAFQQELARCQRLYEKSYDRDTQPGTASNTDGVSLAMLNGAASASYAPGASVAYKVNKRIVPTAVTFYSPVTGSAGKVRDVNNGADVTPTLQASGQSGFAWSATNSAGYAGTMVEAHWTADARLALQ
ncbi:MAG TPA: hypothetical protein VMB84_03435, partial [Stellaceae bacterium]|nr:hypothetical protein [Stellaceae bacterium]